MGSCNCADASCLGTMDPDKVLRVRRRSGWRVRLLTRPGPKAGPSEDEVGILFYNDCLHSLFILHAAMQEGEKGQILAIHRKCVLVQIRAGWQLDSKSSLIVVDPTSPNILQFWSGADVNRLLSRTFFVELQSRYGNLFYVREEVR